MIRQKYIDGYEGEGRVLVYCLDNDQNQNGMMIWEGYFEFLLAACYYKTFPKGGLLEAYYYHNGFYENSPWQIENIGSAATELENFDIRKIDTISPEIAFVVQELKKDLISFFKKMICEGKEVYIEYN